MNSTSASMRVAICGAGPAGLATASILAREAAAGTFTIDVFERQDRERDQGAGWDIDVRGQKILRRAGIDPKKISRPGSDMVRMFHSSGEEKEDKQPWMAIGNPSYLQWLGGDEPETNRHLLREELLKAVSEKKVENEVRVHFDCGVATVDRDGAADDGKIRLAAEDGSLLGEYDLIIDASGIHSSLRQTIFPNDSVHEQSFTGFTILHGMIESPEASLNPLLVRRLGEGTMLAQGAHSTGQGGRMMGLQRFGAEKDDKRCTFTWMHHTEMKNEATGIVPGAGIQRQPQSQSLSAELGLDSKRTWFSPKHDPVGFEKIKAFIKGDMGREWDSMYHQTVDSLSSIAIRPQFMLPTDPTTASSSASASAPLICIGDALHAVPAYTGKGGNTALADAADLATSLLAHVGTVDTPTPTPTPKPVPTTPNLPELLRREEQKYLARVREEAAPREEAARDRLEWIWAKEGFTPERDWTVGAMLTCGGDRDDEGYGWTWEKRGVTFVMKLLKLANALEGYGMGKAVTKKTAAAAAASRGAGAGSKAAAAAAIP